MKSGSKGWRREEKSHCSYYRGERRKHVETLLPHPELGVREMGSFFSFFICGPLRCLIHPIEPISNTLEGQLSLPLATHMHQLTP